ELAYKWQQAGISQGDTVLIHSSLKRTLKNLMKQEQKISPEVILDSFLEAVGLSGTLLLPLFNFDFTKGIAFDYRNTPSQMGVLTEVARIHPNAIRTGHPIYSFAIIGHNS
ncbi:AAC(3) family N-acetyltransferase, partial [Planktothrix sp.]|uniref:AAC(3) family N-acetyltransferase n=1 Tax=Planktothrix sp. TaxID=3088171 RepID=UPI0038D49E2F